MQDASTTGTKAETEPKHRGPLNRQRGGYSGELESWLTSNSALMGERSNFGGLKAAIERGGSGGCKGTKGVGRDRIEPFENWTGKFFERVHEALDRSDRCWMAWRGLTDYGRNLLSARYLYGRLKLPPGLHGQLGDLSAVAYVVADRLGLGGRLVNDIANGHCRQWESICAIALEEAHRDWYAERATAETECAAEAVAE